MCDPKWTAFAAAIALLASTTGAPGAGMAQEREVIETSVSLGSDRSRLELELADGRRFEVALADGRVAINGSTAARYGPGGALESAWRELLRRAAESPAGLAAGWDAFAGGEYGTEDRPAARAIRAALSGLVGSSAGAPNMADTVTRDPTADAETAAAAPARQGGDRDIVEGGLVVELSEIEGAARTLDRLVPGLPSDVAQALSGPMRIIVEASDYRLPAGARLDRSLLLVDTDAVLEGIVEGDVIVADGSLRIGSGARIEGNVLSLEGRVRNEGGTVTGRIRDIEQILESSRVRVAPVRVDVRRDRSMFHYIGRGFGSLVGTLAAYLIWLFMGALVVYFFRGQLENVSDTVSFNFGRSFLAGLAAEILFFPVLLVLVVLVLTWLAIPFYIVGFGLAGFLGFLAVAHAIGENLTRRRFSSWPARLRRSNSYYYVLNGLAVLLAIFAAAAVIEMAGPLLGWARGLLQAAGWLVTWIALTVGLGAVLLSRAGTRRAFARPREVPDLGVSEPADRGA